LESDRKITPALRPGGGRRGFRPKCRPRKSRSGREMWRSRAASGAIIFGAGFEHASSTNRTPSCVRPEPAETRVPGSLCLPDPARPRPAPAALGRGDVSEGGVAIRRNSPGSGGSGLRPDSSQHGRIRAGRPEFPGAAARSAFHHLRPATTSSPPPRSSPSGRPCCAVPPRSARAGQTSM